MGAAHQVVNGCVDLGDDLVGDDRTTLDQQYKVPSTAPTVRHGLCRTDAHVMLQPMRRGRSRSTFRVTPLRRPCGYARAYATRFGGQDSPIRARQPRAARRARRPRPPAACTGQRQRPGRHRAAAGCPPRGRADLAWQWPEPVILVLGSNPVARGVAGTSETLARRGDSRHRFAAGPRRRNIRSASTPHSPRCSGHG